MGETTKIEWCHHTFNPWIGCTKVAPECAHCYAEELMAKRWKKVDWGEKGERKRTTTWKDPVKWNREAEAAGERRRVFCASLADVFENKPELVGWRNELFDLIDATPWLDWLLLTKRPENIKKMWTLPKRVYRDLNIPLSDTAAIERITRRDNVWLGTSCGHVESEKRIKDLLTCRELAPVLFLSMEPLLTPVNVGPYLPPSNVSNPVPSVDWVIVGGESGRDARPLDLEWARDIQIRCEVSGVPCFVKQLGAKVRMSFEEWNDLTNGGSTGSVKFVSDEPGSDFGIWTPADTKGGDPLEWPADLCVREFPEVGR